MARKLQETALIEELVAQHESPNSHRTGKKKKKNKHRESEFEEEKELNIKRKLEEETEFQQGSKKEKKKKKTKEEKENGEGKHQEVTNRKESETHELTQVVNCKEGGEETVTVTGKDAQEAKYVPLKYFSDSNLPDSVLTCCMNFKNPSPIQAHAWPFLLDGRDFIGIAKTGSGKTLAYGIPAIMHVLNKRKGALAKRVNPLCLVLAPTRELADQISAVLHDAGEPCGVKSVCLYGGTSKGPQISSLKSGVVGCSALFS